MHRNQHNTSLRPHNNTNKNDNNDKFIDQNQAMYDDDDDEGVLDRTIGGRKVKANANVFEIVGREPETEELLQVEVDWSSQQASESQCTTSWILTYYCWNLEGSSSMNIQRATDRYLF